MLLTGVSGGDLFSAVSQWRSTIAALNRDIAQRTHKLTVAALPDDDMRLIITNSGQINTSYYRKTSVPLPSRPWFPTNSRNETNPTILGHTPARTSPYATPPAEIRRRPRFPMGPRGPAGKFIPNQSWVTCTFRSSHRSARPGYPSGTSRRKHPYVSSCLRWTADQQWGRECDCSW